MAKPFATKTHKFPRLPKHRAPPAAPAPRPRAATWPRYVYPIAIRTREPAGRRLRAGASWTTAVCADRTPGLSLG
eukprot:1555256-Prymnesium_polylepis.1